MSASHGLSIFLAIAVVVSGAASAFAAKQQRKSCYRTPGGFTICQQGDQTCTTAPNGKTVCMHAGASPPPPTSTCYNLPDGTRVCINTP